MKAFLAFLFGLLSFGAEAAPLDTPSYAKTLSDSPKVAAAPPKEDYDLLNVLTYDFFANLTAVRYDNALAEENLKNQLAFNYQLSINNRAKFRRFAFRTFFLNEYGFRHFFDSTTEKTTDAYTFRNALEIPLLKACGLNFIASYELKSQLWPTRKTRETDSGSERYLFSDYLSPGYRVFSFGWSWQHESGATIDFGLVGGKITRIKNQNLYDTRQTDVLYNVRRGAKDTTDFGVNVVINVPPCMVSKRIGWAFNANVFATRQQLSRLKGYTLDLSNAVHFLFLKNLRLSLLTQVKYDEAIQNRVFWTNQFMLGFYLSNKI